MIQSSCGKDYLYAHVTGRTLQSSWPELPMTLVWEIFCDNLRKYAQPGGPHVNAFVLMHNHFHLLITERVSKITLAVESLASNIENCIRAFSGIELPVFEAVPDQFLITDLKHLRNVYRYIYQNPVQVGLVARAEDYPFSTLGFLLGKKRDLSTPPVNDTFGIIYDPMRMLRWINNPELECDLWEVQ